MPARLPTVKATTRYPYGDWHGLSRTERWLVTLAAGYHPGTGAVLAPPDTGTCKQCVFVGYEFVGSTDERVYVCRKNPRDVRQVRLKWPACRLFTSKEHLDHAG